MAVLRVTRMQHKEETEKNGKLCCRVDSTGIANSSCSRCCSRCCGRRRELLSLSCSFWREHRRGKKLVQWRVRRNRRSFQTWIPYSAHSNAECLPPAKFSRRQQRPRKQETEHRHRGSEPHRQQQQHHPAWAEHLPCAFSGSSLRQLKGTQRNVTRHRQNEAPPRTHAHTPIR